MPSVPESDKRGRRSRFADETRARVPGLRGRSDLEISGEAVIETVRARRPELGYRAALRAEALANVRRYALGRPGASRASVASPHS